ncbi:MAG: peptidylprolyl isomerase [Bacteroidota bacterium]
MKKSFLWSLVVLFVLVNLACESESKSKKSNPTNKNDRERVEERNTPEVRIPSDGSESIDVSLIKTIKQEDLIPFLERYEYGNTESYATISTEFGDIKIQLFAAPNLHRANFVRLAKLGYFDTTVFHRVAEDFVIQGGNSEKKSTQQMRQKIGKVLIPNEFKPIHRHTYGAVAAAKYTEKNQSNASSPFEFYIVANENGAKHLDEEHTVFGRVIEGMDVVEKISKVEVDESEWPIQDIPMKVTVSRKK